MEWVEEEGKLKSEVFEKALNRIGLTEEKVKIEIIEENKRKFGILGSNYIKMRVHYDPVDQIVSMAREIVENILNKMDITSVVEKVESNVGLCFNITSPQSALIIGKHGQTIDALQYIVNRMVGKKMDRKANIVLDTENYREKHVGKIESMAKRMAEQVESTGQPVVLAPMNSHDRRIVHLALQNNKRIRTISKGEGPKRKIKIALRYGEERKPDQITSET